MVVVVVVMVVIYFFGCDLSKTRTTSRIVVVVCKGCMFEVPTVYAIDGL